VSDRAPSRSLFCAISAQTADWSAIGELCVRIDIDT
jgi:hypothetical protein